MNWLAKLMILTCLCGPVLAAPAKFFPFPYSVDRLTNGLQVITVQSGPSDLAALYIIVRTGSRNEVEEGKSGFAHFFEHMMFRGSKKFTPELRDAILKRAGAEANAYTSDDRTVYHEFFAKEDLDAVMELEADRFQNLNYSVEAYKTEAKAVLGEYNKSNSNPINKLYEVLRETAFQRHTYKHSTMGFLKDIEEMPNLFDYSLEFYKRYYRPEYATILVVGDVPREQVLAAAKRSFSDWKRGDYAPIIPIEPPAQGPKTAQVDWPAPTLPLLAVAYHAPAYSDEKIDKAALDFLVPIAFGEDSDLYQRLALKEQKVDLLAPDFDAKVDPELFAVLARVKDPKDVEYVRDQIIATFERFSREIVPAAKLAETKSRQRYGTALEWDSPNAIAGFLAPYIGLRSSVATIENYYEMSERITPEDVRRAAQQYFTPANRVVITLAKRSEKEAK